MPSFSHINSIPELAFPHVQGLPTHPPRSAACSAHQSRDAGTLRDCSSPQELAWRVWYQATQFAGKQYAWKYNHFPNMLNNSGWHFKIWTVKYFFQPQSLHHYLSLKPVSTEGKAGSLCVSAWSSRPSQGNPPAWQAGWGLGTLHPEPANGKMVQSLPNLSPFKLSKSFPHQHNFSLTLMI